MNRIIKILDKDLSDAYDAISRDTSVTWYKPLYTFENGDKLCLAASMMDFDGDGYDGYMKLAILPKNAGMSEYDMDFVMPYNPVTGDVYDTESGFVEHYSADDVNYWNEQARSIVDMLERGELVASSRKAGEKRPVKSGRVTKDMWNEHLTELAIPKKDKIKYGLGEDDFFDEYSPSPETPPFELQEELEEDDDTVPFFNDVDERDNYYYSHVKSSRKPIQSMAAVSRDKLMDAGSLGDTIMRDLKLNSIINDPDDFNYPIETSKEWNPSQYYLDIKGFGEIKVLVNQDNYRTNRKNGSYSIELSSRKPGDKFENFKNTYYEGNNRNEFNADWNDILSQMISLDNVITQMNSSRRPIQSMYVTQDISGNDLYTCLWSGGKDQFDSMIEDGADPDDILNACEELLFREEGNPPTMTELNDLIWFEPDTIRDYIGLSNPIESGCHGKSKKKGKKKAVKSAAQISEIHNATSDCFVRITRSDVPEVGKVNDTIPLYEFKDNCRSYAETTNGSYYVTMDDTYEGEYFVEFSTGDTTFAPEDQRDDPYYNESLGTLQFEVIWNPGQELCNYLND